MHYLRPATARGRANFGWLDSRHSFSFGNYYDRQHMGFSVLRVINDDSVKAGAGFDAHSHRDMEIISYILDGAIEHEDSIGNRFIVPAGEVQLMTAGTGITHSEYNASKSEPLKFLQIWIEPKFTGLKPGYQQANIAQTGSLTPLVTDDGRGNSLRIHQDVNLYRLRLSKGQEELIELDNRAGYLHMVKGSGEVASQSLQAGDGLGLSAIDTVTVTAAEDDFEALWFDLPEPVKH